MRHQTRPWIVLPPRPSRLGTAATQDGLWLPADSNALVHLSGRMKQAPHGSARVRAFPGGRVALFQSAVQQAQDETGVELPVGPHGAVVVLDGPVDGDVVGEPVDVTARVGDHVTFSYPVAGDEFESVRLDREDVALLAAVTARETDDLTAALERLGRVAPGRMVQLVRSFGDRGENSWEAAQLLRSHFPAGFPDPTLQMLIGHPKRSVREACLRTFSRTQGSRAPSQKRASRSPSRSG